jgi:hypothetical protein
MSVFYLKKIFFALQSVFYLWIFFSKKRHFSPEKRFCQLENKVNKINLIGFSSPALTPFTKAFLYTTYIFVWHWNWLQPDRKWS